mmetsp:Transcript_48247/g.160877  ORF Transcript_48247/g.160877 Transcript_48247/m.160877 type:complete len:313 (-) Transcript_48247:1100-2038(-)
MHRVCLLLSAVSVRGFLTHSAPPPQRAVARSPQRRAVALASGAAAASATAAEARLLELLSGTEGRGAALTADEDAEVHRRATELEADSTSGATNDSPLLPGRWRVLYQGKPGGEKTEFFSLESWRKYLSGDGPSPIQNLVSGSSTVSRLYQVVELSEGGEAGRINNVVDLSPRAVIAIEAELEGKPSPSRLGFRFSGGRVLVRTLWNATLNLPYPVPFDLLGDNAKGWLQTDYLSPSLRLSRGNKGSLFVLVPEPRPDDPELEALLQPPPPPPRRRSRRRRRPACRTRPPSGPCGQRRVGRFRRERITGRGG